MDPIVQAAALAALAAIIGAVIGLRSTQVVERSKVVTSSNTKEIELISLQLDSWQGLVEVYRTADEEHRRTIEEQRTVIEGLRAALDHCREHHGKGSG